MSNETKIHFTGDRLIIEERKGALPDLPKLEERKQVSIYGTLSSPFDFVNHRDGHIDKTHAVVTVDRKALSIVVQTNPNSSLFNDVVEGTIEVNPDLKNFKINQVGSHFSRETLLGFFRTNRQYFPDKEQHGQLMSTIKNLQVKVNIASGRNEDNRGNRDNNLKKEVVAENIPVSTIIEIPVFVGERPVKLQLDICYDTTEQNVFFWFESAELNEIIYNASNERIQAEVDKIRELGYLVIEK